MSTPITEVPWMIEGGAKHTVQVARNLSYAAFGGREGVVREDALSVLALTVPGTSVRVLRGTCALRNRAAGAVDEMYVVRVGSEQQVDIAATGASPRSDLLVARVENPWASGETWPDPADPTVGPYASLAIISGIPSTTTSVDDLGLTEDHSMLPLARIDLPANTGTVTQEMIHDLRSLANPTFGDAPGGFIPVGGMVEYGGDAAPLGWLIADGSEVSRTTYAALFEVYGTKYGAGNGSTTFNLPDRRKRVGVGRDQSAAGYDTLGEKGGEESHVLSVAEMPWHNHGGGTGTQSANHTHSGGTSANGAHSHAYTVTTTGSVSVKGDGANPVYRASQGLTSTSVAGNHSHTFVTGAESTAHAHSIPAQGGGAAHNNMPPYVVMNYIIRT